MNDTPTDEAEDPASRLLSEADADTVEVGNLLSNLRSSLFGGSASGQKVGRYELRKRLGVGGVGVVYSAWDPELSREVAVKLLRPEKGAGPGWMQRMAREAQAMARIDHPNVVEVFDVGTHERESGGVAVFIVMPLLEGVSLAEWFRERPTWRRVVQACIDAGRGLAAAHELGLVHRDFKPGNAMIDANDHVRVLDFGLVGADDSESSGSNQEDGRVFPAGLTVTGSMLGTPPYMAPEQHDAGVVGPAADQFALCATLFEGLYGTRAFPQQGLLDLVEAKRERRLPEVEAVGRRLSQIIERGLTPEPSDRFASMGELCEALERVLRGRSTVRWIGGIAAGLGLLGLLMPSTKDAEPCADWNAPPPLSTSEATERVREHFGDVSGALGTEVAERVTALLAEHDAAMSEARIAACTPSATITTERRQRMQTCINESHAAALELVDRLGNARGRGIATAVAAVLRLPDPTGCSGADPLVPEDPALGELRRDANRLDTLVEQADFDGGLALAGIVVGLAQSLDAPQIEVRGRRNLGQLLAHNDVDEAVVQFTRAGLLAQSIGSHDLAVITWVNLAQLYFNVVGNIDAGAQAVQRAEETATYVEGDLATQRMVMIGRGELARAQGRPADAVAAYERAVEIAKEVYGDDSPEVVDSLHQLGLSYRHSGQLEEARESLARAVEIDRDLHGPMYGDLVAQYGNLGTVEYMLEDYEAALRSFEKALEIEQASGRGLTRRAARLHGRIAATHAELEQLDEAAAAYEQALAELDELGVRRRPAGAEVLLNYAVLEERRGKLDQAIARTREAIETYRAGGQRDQLGRALLNLSGYLIKAELPDEARALAQEVVQLHADGKASDEQLARAKGHLAKLDEDAAILPP